MIPAYDENILAYAMDNLGVAFDYVVNFLKLGGQEFMDLFAASGIADEFGQGNDRYTCGMTGRNLAEEIYSICGKRIAGREGEVNGDYSPAYWVGWILAYYQWRSGLPFRKILSVLSFEKLMNLYGVLHEADPSKSVEILDAMVYAETFLARMRKKRGMTQAALAAASRVSLRSIQLYEQRKNDIRKAQYNHLKDMADVLHCSIEDILG